ncbi:MAG: polysaccharide export protein [Proteobacteria bacterium]|nr:polysaccharide export protein [Pseudomonadota bacterium]
MKMQLKALYYLLALMAGSFAFPAGALDSQQQYRLGSGDELRINVFGEETLSGDFQVGARGVVAMPLVGGVPALGLTINQLEAAIENKLKPDYLKNPQVSVEVLNYRPFYILGEVNDPGGYPFVSGMSVLEAVALAGGFTYRAKTSKVYIRRASNQKEELISITEVVLPGDIIRVRERIF